MNWTGVNLAERVRKENNILIQIENSRFEKSQNNKLNSNHKSNPDYKKNSDYRINSDSKMRTYILMNSQNKSSHFNFIKSKQGLKENSFTGGKA